MVLVLKQMIEQNYLLLQFQPYIISPEKVCVFFFQFLPNWFSHIKKGESDTEIHFMFHVANAI